MGILALIPFSVIKELCDGVKRDKKSFTGKIKSKKRKNERKAGSSEKIDDVKRLLVSAARPKAEAIAKRNSRKRKRSADSATKENLDKEKSDGSSSESSSGSSTESSGTDSDTGSESTDDSDNDRNPNGTNESDRNSQ